MPDISKPRGKQRDLQLRVVHNDEISEAVDTELEGREKTEKEKVEEFWAGKNHAMRRSGRVAA